MCSFLIKRIPSFEPIEIVIPKYIRKVKMSESQRPIYYEFDGKTIKAKSKKLLQIYIEDKKEVTRNYGNVLPRHLKADFCVVFYYKGKVYRSYSEYAIEYTSKRRRNRSKGLSEDRFREEAKRLLYDNANKELVVANIRHVGTPRMQIIRGQDFYSGNLREFARVTVIKAIKDSYIPHLPKTLPIVYPIRMTMEIHNTIKNEFDNTKEGAGRRWDIDNHAYPYAKSFVDCLTEQGLIVDDDRLHITQPPAAIFCPIEDYNDRKLVFRIFHDDRKIIQTNKHYATH